MRLKLLAGFFVLSIAIVLQLWLASAGWYLDLSFAALISFAFVFGFWELALLIVIAVFIMNWQPAVSVEIILFALFPLVIYASRNFLRWQVWLEDILAIFIGSLLLYLVGAHARFSLSAFSLDVVADSAFGIFILWPLYRWGKE